MRDVLAPVTDAFEPADAARVRLTVSCRDADHLPKVEQAGQVVLRDGEPVQVMHNGVVVAQGCYFGPWMDEIIRCLRGHHEPQEEVAVAAVLQRLRERPTAGRRPTAVEVGSFWAYYGLWFLHELPEGRTVSLEPDPANLEVGRHNFALNGRTGVFLHGAVGARPGQLLSFVAESTGEPVEVEQYDLPAIMAAGGLDHVDVLFADIQGAELDLLRGAAPLLRAGAVRFLVLSTHHHEISGSVTTHQDALSLLRELGAHVVTEHTVGESFSGDGLVVAAFDPADADLVVSVSHARYSESLFGSLEPHMEHLRVLAEQRAATTQQLQDRLRAVQAQLAEASERSTRAEAELGALLRTRLLRWSSPVRAGYGRLRGGRLRGAGPR